MFRSLGFAAFMLSAVLLQGGPLGAQQLSQANLKQLREAEGLETQMGNLSNQGKYAEATAVGRRVLAIRRKVLGDVHLETAHAQEQLGSVLKRQSQLTEALKLFEQTLETRTKLSGEEDPFAARSLSNIGHTRMALGEIALAKQCFERALGINRKALGEKHGNTADCIGSLAEVFRREGNIAKAREFHEQALAIQREALEPNNMFLAYTLNNLGMVLLESGDLEGASSRLEEALKITRANYGDDHPETAERIGNLAGVHEARGDFSTAQVQYEQVLEMRGRLLGKNHLHYASALTTLGNLHLKLGNPSRAREYFEGALAVRRKAFGDRHEEVGFSLNSVATAFEDLGDNMSARRHFEEALTVLEKVLGPSHPETAVTANNLASVLKKQGDFQGALVRYEKALAITREIRGNDHPTTAAIMSNLGSLHATLGNYEKALPYTRQSLEIRLNVLGEDHPDSAHQLLDMALLEARAGNWSEAREFTDRERRSVRKHLGRALSGLSSGDQLGILKRDEINFHAALTQGLVRTEDPATVEASASWLINGKGMTHESLAAQQLLMRGLDDPESKELIQELLEVRRQLSHLAISSARTEQGEAFRKNLEELAAKERQLSQQFAVRAGRPVDGGRWVELDAVRAAIPADAVLITMARFDAYNHAAMKNERRWQPARYAAWIVPPAGAGAVRIIDLGLAEEIEPAVEQVRTAMSESGKSNGSIKKDGEEAAEQRLRSTFGPVTERVWKPLAAQIPEGTKQLILSPDGALWLLPWSAIPLDETKFLVEEYSVRLAISGRELASPKGELAGNESLLFADPAFDLSPVKLLEALKAIFRDYKVDENQSRGLVSSMPLMKVPPLPNTHLEAMAIAPSIQEITGKDPVKYLGQFALERVVKEVHSPQVMLISTHGFFLPDQKLKDPDPDPSSDTRSASLLTVQGVPLENPLLRCGLLLAGCNQPQDGGDDGILTGLEIVGLDLRGTDLVVLSACETGIGQVQTGEGVAGLRQAFQLAGSKGVVATLWSVPDRDSAIIMQTFFQQLASNQKVAEALRSAQLKRIESRRERYGAAHPFFWAAWTVTGPLISMKE